MKKIIDLLVLAVIITASILFLVWACLISPIENTCPEEDIKTYEDI